MSEKDNKNRKISLSEVAAAAGVSKMTASRVIRENGGYSEDTRKRVLAEVERLGYLPNRLASVFAGDQKSTIVGVSIPDLANEVFTQILEGIDRKLGSFGHQTVLGMSRYGPSEEEAWIKTMLSWQPAGLIVTGRAHTPRAVEMMKASGLPIVEIWDLNSSPLDMCVGLNHFDSGYDMGRHLIGRGYRKLAYVGTGQESGDAAEMRLKGFERAVSDGGGSILKRLLLRDVPNYYPGFYGTEQLLAGTNGVEAVFYQNDNMAVGGLNYCQSAGLRVPDDLAIAGWGDLPVLSIQPLRVTTVKVPNMRLGGLAAEALLANLHGMPVQDVTDVGFQLVPGASA